MSQELDVQEFQPYVGPRPFERQDHGSFFGRAREISELRSLVIAQDVVLLYAQSGAGKSSLLNAGLIPRLLADDIEVFPVGRVSGLVPRRAPAAEVRNLHVYNALMSWSTTEMAQDRLLGMSMAEYLAGIEHPPHPGRLRTPRVVFFDQFEELFSAYPERWQDRDDFFSQAREALDADPLLRFVFVLREDYLAQLDPYVDHLPDRLRTRRRLERLREGPALDAVVKPLAQRGVSFEPGVAQEIVSELMRVRYETPGGRSRYVDGEFVEPVQLQVVCYQLWELVKDQIEERREKVITRRDVRSAPDVDRALRTFYEDCVQKALKEASISEAALRTWFQESLITPAGTRGLVYRDERSGETGSIPNSVVDQLEDLHIIRREMRSGSQWYELPHDRMIEPVQQSNELWRAEILLRQESGVTLQEGAANVMVDGQEIQVNLGTLVGSELQEQRESRNRGMLVERVRATWIEGVLEGSLYGVARLKLGLEARPDAVERPLTRVMQEREAAPQPLPRGMRMGEVFDESEETLLILGAPGTGKTTMLLELADTLLDRAQRSPAAPVPVVFSLASWATRRPFLREWLVGELNTRYDLSRTAAADWVERDAILPLLDGLDEMSVEHRVACVGAINAYRQAHARVPLAVGCRTNEYEALPVKLQLSGAVALLTLTREQVDDYLAQAGEALAGLREVLAKDETLYEMLNTPLMLSALAMAGRRERLFGTYVQRTFEQRTSIASYEQARSERWLAWLAHQMHERGQNVFFLEHMQPDWLPTQAQHRVVTWGAALLSGLFGWLVLALVFVPLGALMWAGTGALTGLSIALLLALIVGGAASGGRQPNRSPVQLAETLRWSWAAARGGLRRRWGITVFVGLAFGLLGLVTPGGVIAGLGAGLGSVFLIALAKVFSHGLVAGEMVTRTTPGEGIRRSARNAWLTALAIGLVWAGAGGLTCLASSVAAILALAVGIVFALIGGLRKGGFACLQHLVLRLLLRLDDLAPWRLISFLDDMAGRNLLQKVGGGYIFVHRLLFEWFADKGAEIQGAAPQST